MKRCKYCVHALMTHLRSLVVFRVLVQTCTERVTIMHPCHSRLAPCPSRTPSSAAARRADGGTRARGQTHRSRRRRRRNPSKRGVVPIACAPQMAACGAVIILLLEPCVCLCVRCAGIKLTFYVAGGNLPLTFSSPPFFRASGGMPL